VAPRGCSSGSSQYWSSWQSWRCLRGGSRSNRHLASRPVHHSAEEVAHQSDHVLRPSHLRCAKARFQSNDSVVRTARSARAARIAACGGSGGRANRPSVPSHRYRPPPSDQTEDQARFECMRLVRAGAISDAELLRLRDEALSWCAVLDRINDRWLPRVSAGSLAAS
jgi:hypothetical protein